MAATPVSGWSESEAPGVAARGALDNVRQAREFREYTQPSRIGGAAQLMGLLAASALIGGFIVVAILMVLLDLLAGIAR